MSLKVILGIVAAALVALTVAVVVLINTLNQQARQEAYEACLSRFGFERDELTYDLEGLAAAADACASNR